jgi:hypothetical protein
MDECNSQKPIDVSLIPSDQFDHNEVALLTTMDHSLPVLMRENEEPDPFDCEYPSRMSTSVAKTEFFLDTRDLSGLPFERGVPGSFDTEGS